MTFGQANLKFTKPLKWILFALCFKTLFYFTFIHGDTNPRKNTIACFSKLRDYDEYIRPINNLIEKGTYSLDGKTEPYAGRLPGFVFPYIIFRAVFNEYTSNILLGIFILALSIIASYVFSRLIYNLIKRRWAFISAFFLLNCVPFFWHFDWALHANSLAASCFIFFLHFLYFYFENKKPKYLLLAGFFIAWVALLRGFCLILIPVSVLFLIYLQFTQKHSIKQIAITSFMFILPFSFFEGIWITRNYISLNEFIPLQTSFVPGSDSKNPEYSTGMITKHSMMSVRKLIFAWGGDNTWYFKNSDMAWFVRKNDPLAKDFQFSKSIFFEGFTIDSLELLKSSIVYSFEHSLPKTQADSVENVISSTANRYHARFIENKKLYFYLYAPLLRFKHFLLRNPTQDWPGPSFSNCNIMQKTIRILSALQYILLLSVILIFPFAYFSKKIKSADSHFYLFLYLLLIIHVLPFISIIYMSHYSYFIFGYILLIPLFTFSIHSFLNNKTNG